MSHDHHDHDHHDHDHGSHLSEVQARVRALESVLTEKGYVDPAVLDHIVEHFETKVGPHVGAKIIARAWTDPAFKAALLADATRAVVADETFGRVGDHLVAVENTETQHHMVVCTLCSCYPWDVLGLPPVWYKSAPYRSRVVMDPRGVLADFGVTLPAAAAPRDSASRRSSPTRVSPSRPAGTDGWSEEQLASLVTRNSMIGTGLALQPGEVKR